MTSVIRNENDYYVFDYQDKTVDMEAAHSFRYRLREAAKQALTLGDTLLQMSQDASEPTDKQLEELGSIEQSLRVVIKYRVPDMKPCASTG